MTSHTTVLKCLTLYSSRLHEKDCRSRHTLFLILQLNASRKCHRYIFITHFQLSNESLSHKHQATTCSPIRKRIEERDICVSDPLECLFRGLVQVKLTGKKNSSSFKVYFRSELLFPLESMESSQEETRNASETQENSPMFSANDSENTEVNFPCNVKEINKRKVWSEFPDVKFEAGGNSSELPQAAANPSNESTGSQVLICKFHLC